MEKEDCEMVEREKSEMFAKGAGRSARLPFWEVDTSTIQHRSGCYSMKHKVLLHCISKITAKTIRKHQHSYVNDKPKHQENTITQTQATLKLTVMKISRERSMNSFV